MFIASAVVKILEVKLKYSLIKFLSLWKQKFKQLENISCSSFLMCVCVRYRSKMFLGKIKMFIY